MTKVSVAINGRTWFTYVLRTVVSTCLPSSMRETLSAANRVSSLGAIGRAWAAAGATPTLPVGPGVSFLRCVRIRSVEGGSRGLGGAGTGTVAERGGGWTAQARGRPGPFDPVGAHPASENPHSPCGRSGIIEMNDRRIAAVALTS